MPACLLLAHLLRGGRGGGAEVKLSITLQLNRVTNAAGETGAGMQHFSFNKYKKDSCVQPLSIGFSNKVNLLLQIDYNKKTNTKIVPIIVHSL